MSENNHVIYFLINFDYAINVVTDVTFFFTVLFRNVFSCLMKVNNET